MNQLIQDYSNKGALSTEPWDIEAIDEERAFSWFREHPYLPFQVTGIYLVVIFVGKYMMNSRTRFDLRIPLLCWSAVLAIFSIIGSVRSWIVFRSMYEAGGIHGVICQNFYIQPIGKYWGLVFCLSKMPELVDTVFIVLRKQKLIFLHWYHHVTVLLFSWHCYAGQKQGGGVFMVMNFFVHAMMYSYYALRAGRVKVPRPVALIVTTCQILQMVLGVATFYLLYNWRNTEDCSTDSQHLLYGGIMYLSYLILFCNFFYQAYIKPSATAEIKSKNGNNGTLNGSTFSEMGNRKSLHLIENSDAGSSLRSRRR